MLWLQQPERLAERHLVAVRLAVAAAGHPVIPKRNLGQQGAVVSGEPFAAVDKEIYEKDNLTD
jgi:hypothetical protein